MVLFLFIFVNIINIIRRNHNMKYISIEYTYQVQNILIIYQLQIDFIL